MASSAPMLAKLDRAAVVTQYLRLTCHVDDLSTERVGDGGAMADDSDDSMPDLAGSSGSDSDSDGTGSMPGLAAQDSSNDKVRANANFPVGSSKVGGRTKRRQPAGVDGIPFPSAREMPPAAMNQLMGMLHCMGADSLGTTEEDMRHVFGALTEQMMWGNDRDGSDGDSEGSDGSNDSMPGLADDSSDDEADAKPTAASKTSASGPTDEQMRQAYAEFCKQAMVGGGDASDDSMPSLAGSDGSESDGNDSMPGLADDSSDDESDGDDVPPKPSRNKLDGEVKGRQQAGPRPQETYKPVPRDAGNDSDSDGSDGSMPSLADDSDSDDSDDMPRLTDNSSSSSSSDEGWEDDRTNRPLKSQPGARSSSVKPGSAKAAKPKAPRKTIGLEECKEARQLLSSLPKSVHKDPQTQALAGKLIAAVVEAEKDPKSFVPKGHLLHHAAELECVPLVKPAVIIGYDVDEVHLGDGDTPLVLAAKTGNAEMAKELLAAGAGAGVPAAAGNWATPLAAAVAGSHVEVVRLLVAAGCDVERAIGKRKGSTPLRAAINKGHLGMVKELLGAPGCKVDGDSSRDKATPLLSAVEQGHAGIVKALLEAGANPNLDFEGRGSTALYRASGKGDLQMVKTLLAAGANQNVRCVRDHGTTPLVAATINGHASTVNALLKGGADLHLTDDKGLAPIHHAADQGHCDIIRIMLGAGAQVNMCTFTTRATPLALAAIRGHRAAVNQLLQAEADVRAATCYLSDEGHPSAASFLKRLAKAGQQASAHMSAEALAEEQRRRDALAAELLAEEERAAAGAGGAGGGNAAPKEKKKKNKKKKKKTRGGGAAADGVDSDEEDQVDDSQEIADLLALESNAEPDVVLRVREWPLDTHAVADESQDNPEADVVQQADDAKAEAGAEGEAGGDPEDAFALMAELEEMMLEVEPAQEVAPAAPKLSAEELAEEHRRSEVLAEELMAELMLAEEEELMAVVSGSDAPDGTDPEQSQGNDEPRDQELPMSGSGAVGGHSQDSPSAGVAQAVPETVSGSKADPAGLDGEPALEIEKAGSPREPSAAGGQGASHAGGMGDVLTLMDGDLKVYQHKVLGHGCAGTLCLEGSWDGMGVAVKVLLRELAADAMEEKRMLRAITHKNVLRFFTSTGDASRLYLVLELCQCNLEQAVHGGRLALLGADGRPNATCMQLARGMVEGVAELHRMGVVHRDLKPRNVLLATEPDGSWVAKISDLGLSKHIGHGQSSFMSDRAGGTRGWQAPEQLQPPPGGVYRMQKRMDIFNLGCLLHYCFTGGRHPFPGEGFQQMLNILHGNADLSALAHLPLYRALVGGMLAVDPAARPSMEAIQEHPVWWGAQARLQFLSRLSDFLAVEERAGLRESLHSVTAGWVLGKGAGSWMETLDGPVQAGLQMGHQGAYYDGTVASLLRAVRNARGYCHQWGAPAHAALGGASEEAVHEYFDARFPWLFPATWQWACDNPQCAADEDLQRWLGRWAAGHNS
eukprot:jgi/Tetstr1/439035/TSEL_027527.t1